MNGLFNFMDGEGKATMGMVAFIGSLWLINGYTQGMGFPPCGSLMAHWIKPSELATKQAIWNSSHSIGASLVAFLCGTFILNHFSYSAWQWCFFVPALLAIAGAVLVLFGLKDTPASVGLPDPEEIDDNAPVKEVVTEPKEFTDFAYKHRGNTSRRLGDRQVLRQQGPQDLPYRSGQRDGMLHPLLAHP